MGVRHVPLFLFVILGSFLQTTQDNPPITVKSCHHTDVLLKCNCSEMTHGLKWQKNEKNVTVIYSNSSISTSNYTGRIRMFLNENPKNCSILLKNIIKEDDGKYKCIFYEGSKYSKSSVTLKVNINSTECSAPAAPAGSVKGDNSNNHRPDVYIPLTIISALLLIVCIFAVLRIQLRIKDQLRNQPIERDEEAPLESKHPVTAV